MPKDILGQDLKRISNIVSSNITTSNLNTNLMQVNDFVFRAPTITISNSVATTLVYPTTFTPNCTIMRTLTGGANIEDTLPSASALYTTLGCSVGDSFYFDVFSNNSAGSTGQYTILGTGYTYQSFGSLPAQRRDFGQYKVVFTSATSANIYRTSSITNAWNG